MRWLDLAARREPRPPKGGCEVAGSCGSAGASPSQRGVVRLLDLAARREHRSPKEELPSTGSVPPTRGQHWLAASHRPLHLALSRFFATEGYGRTWKSFSVLSSQFSVGICLFLKFRLQFLQSGGWRDQWLVVEVTLRGSDGVAVGTRQLGGDEASHRRFARQRQSGPDCFTEASQNNGCTPRNAALQRWQASGCKQRVDPVPKIDGLRFVDEVRTTGDGAGLLHSELRLQVSCRDVLHIGNGHHVGTIANLPQATTASGLQQPGNQMIVARPPDQMRSQ